MFSAIRARFLGACAVVACASGCVPADHGPAATVPSATADETLCPVTVSEASVKPPVEIDPTSQPVSWAGPDSFWYGNEALWVRLPPQSTLRLQVRQGEALSAKFPWWRMKPGRLVVQATALGGGGETVAATVPEGYGDKGFQVSGLQFSRPGCWRVTGQLGTDRLEFTLLVQRQA